MVAKKKKAPARKKAAPKAASRPTTKSETVAFLAEKANLIKKDVHGLFDGLAAIIKSRTCELLRHFISQQALLFIVSQFLG